MRFSVQNVSVVMLSTIMMLVTTITVFTDEMLV